MSRKSITLAASIAITACLTLPASGESTDPEVCEEPSPPAVGMTNIIYRDSSIDVKPPVTKIGRGTRWRFKLTTPPFSPDEDSHKAFADAAYEDAIVTIKGKTGTPTDKWLHVSGTRDESPLEVCVPTWLRSGQTVFFTVTVESLGTIDPRGDVVN